MNATGPDRRTDRADPRNAGAILRRGHYLVTCATEAADIARAQALRAQCFALPAPDRDHIDARCMHFLVQDLRDGRLVCCFRVLLLDGAEASTDSYSAQFYDLTPLAGYVGRIAEIGRFCMHPDSSDPDVLRIAWGALAGVVERHAVQLLMGCSSFAGVNPAPYRDSFALLRARHLAPPQWRPGPKAPERIEFAANGSVPPVAGLALSRMPSLLRSYLTMGGWVGDHAVVDRQMNTLHVFTGVETHAIPAGRKRLLRRIGGLDGSLRRECFGKDEAAR